MFIRVNNGHLRVRNGTTAVGCGIRMPRDVHFSVPSGQSISKKILGLGIKTDSNIDKITKDITKMAVTKSKQKKYIKF